MTGRAKKYGTFQVRMALHRPGGAVDLVVAYTRSGRVPTYSSYRHEPDGTWKCLNGAWTDLEQAIAETPHLDRYRPLVAPKLRRLLSAQLRINDDTPNDEGDETPCP